ncbi:MAG TPA: metallophosphoesterase [Burkholderiales bacterium]|nr:metallophosphoesterase [Burkholderiales bacterium]
MKTFRVWAGACAHIHSDLREGRRSIAEPIAQSESGAGGTPPFDWDIMLHLGDISGTQAPPSDADGPPVVEQLTSGRKHRIEQIYHLLGNHDASGPGEETQWWFRKWIDPEGVNTRYSQVHADRRPFPIDGNWERYSFVAGNVVFLMMGDRNDGGPPKGRSQKGGWPAGAITHETFEWWKRMVEANADKIIVTCAHHVLRDTTVASGRWEGVRSGYHGHFDDAEGASYLYWVGDDTDSTLFQSYLEAHPRAIDLWLAGHTHTHPDDHFGGKSHIEQRWGVTFVNVAAMTRHHGQHKRALFPLSRLFTFEDGASEVRVQCYLHTDDYAPRGWYPRVERTIALRRPFSAPKA